MPPQGGQQMVSVKLKKEQSFCGKDAWEKARERYRKLGGREKAKKLHKSI